VGGWRRLRIEELHNLYPSPYIIMVIKLRRMRLAGHVACMGEVRNACNILVGRPEEKKSLEISKRRWEDNIKMDSREIGWAGVDWIRMAQDTDQWRLL